MTDPDRQTTCMAAAEADIARLRDDLRDARRLIWAAAIEAGGTLRVSASTLMRWTPGCVLYRSEVDESRHLVVRALCDH